MDIVIISEAGNESLHPVTAQLVGAPSSIGGQISVICPGGVGSPEAAKIAGVSKVISVEGDCFEGYDCMAWSNAIVPLIDGDLVLTSSSAIGREMSSAIAAKKGFPVVQDITSLNDGISVSRSIFSGKDWIFRRLLLFWCWTRTRKVFFAVKPASSRLREGPPATSMGGSSSTRT